MITLKKNDLQKLVADLERINNGDLNDTEQDLVASAENPLSCQFGRVHSLFYLINENGSFVGVQANLEYTGLKAYQGNVLYIDTTKGILAAPFGNPKVYVSMSPDLAEEIKAIFEDLFYDLPL